MRRIPHFSFGVRNPNENTQVIEAIEVLGRVDLQSLAKELGLNEGRIKRIIDNSIYFGQVEGVYTNDKKSFVSKLRVETELLRILGSLRKLRANEAVFKNQKNLACLYGQAECTSLQQLSRELGVPLEYIINTIGHLKNRGELFGVLDTVRGEYINIDCEKILKGNCKLSERVVSVEDLSREWGVDVDQAVKLIQYMLDAEFVKGSFENGGTQFHGIERGNDKEIATERPITEAGQVSRTAADTYYPAPSSKTPLRMPPRTKVAPSPQILDELKELSGIGQLSWRRDKQQSKEDGKEAQGKS